MLTLLVPRPASHCALSRLGQGENGDHQRLLEGKPGSAAKMVTIQITPQSAPSPASWLGEVAAFAQVLTHVGILSAIQEQVCFARARFGQYDVVDFVAVVIGYVLSGEPTLLAFYERLAPFVEPFMTLFGRNQLPHRSTLSRFLSALDQPTVEALRRSFDIRSACTLTVFFSRWPVCSDGSRVSGDRCRRNSASCPKTCTAANGSLACSPPPH
jgi:hypothetical protein